VRERAVQRRLAQVATEIAESALNSGGKEVGQLLDEAESKIFQIAESGARRDQGLIGIAPILGRVYERIDHLHNQDNPSDITGVPTGFTEIDSKTAGLQPGDLIIIAGRPSMGKTALALNIAEHVALHPSTRLPVAIFSMEMSARHPHAVLDRQGRSAQAAHRAAERRGVVAPHRGDGQAARRLAPRRRDRGAQRA
jgi:replicative DNA helicase